MSRLARIGFVATALLLSGCASSLFLPYPARYAQISQQWHQDNTDAALAELEGGLNSNDGLLYQQESGRVAALGGRFEDSIDYYQQAHQAYQQYDWKALVSLSDLTSQVAGSTISDNLIPYRGQAYERVMLHQQQSLNYLWLGKLEDALVEVRLADQAQQLALEAYGEALESQQSLSNAAIDARLTELDKIAGNAPDSFINPYVLYSNAVLYEAAGQANDALIDVRKALQLQPDNPLLQQQFVRLSCLVRIECEQSQKRYGSNGAIGAEQGQVVVLFEAGQVAAKQSLWLPFSWDGNYQQISMPYYYGQRQVTLPTLKLGDTAINLSPLADVDALAARSLREQYPFILARQALRAAAKHGANEWAERSSSEFGHAAMQIFNALTEQADRRSWLSLPQRTAAWHGAVAQGQYAFQVGTKQLQVEVKPGKTTIIWVASSGAYTQMQAQLI